MFTVLNLSYSDDMIYKYVMFLTMVFLLPCTQSIYAYNQCIMTSGPCFDGHRMNVLYSTNKPKIAVKFQNR